MECGRPREFFIGRYIYLKERLDKMPAITFTHRNEQTVLTYFVRDKSTGEKKRRRISEKNSQWDRLMQMAKYRDSLKKQMEDLLTDWHKEYKGSLKDLASNYKLLKPRESRFDTELWNSMRHNQCTKPIKNPFLYKGIKMRSQFETVIASILDEMHLDFKYDVRLDLNKGTVFADFAIHLPEYDRCGFLEYLGALNDLSYIIDNVEKYDNYISSGLYINRDVLFLPGDKNYRPDYRTIKELISAMIGAIAREYVVRKESPECYTPIHEQTRSI